ncbi:MAG: hypothetical protein CUN53_18120 [Phototrophicales bacterium]|nr:MAG: hypothetical protein CUN53_18120 [Phototrophicales bacterium]
MKQLPLDPHTDDLYDSLTDALFADAQDLTPILSRFGVAYAQVNDVLPIVRRLRGSMIRVHPSRRYVYRLRRQLVGAPVRSHGMIARVRYLPPRVQIAAALALVAGAMLIVRRRHWLYSRLVEPIN